MVLCSFSLTNVSAIISIIADTLITFITICLFYKRFKSRGLYFSDLTVSIDTFSPNAIYVSIENRSLNPLIIRKLYLIVKNKYKIQFTIDKPRIIDPYKLDIFEIQYSRLSPEIPIQMFAKNTAILAETQKGYFFDMFCKKFCFKKICLFFRKKSTILDRYECVVIHRDLFNGKIINPQISDYIKFTKKDGTFFYEGFMEKAGLLSEYLPSLGNAIPRDIASEPKKLEKYLTEFADKCDLTVFHIKIRKNEPQN